jgi:hypothetical protein
MNFDYEYAKQEFMKSLEAKPGKFMIVLGSAIALGLCFLFGFIMLLVKLILWGAACFT